jgi:hypothetical protein
MMRAGRRRIRPRSSQVTDKLAPHVNLQPLDIAFVAEARVLDASEGCLGRATPKWLIVTMPLSSASATRVATLVSRVNA